VLRWPPAINAAILLALATLVFIPIRYVYPSRMPVLKVTTNVLGAIWAASMLVMLWQYPVVSPVVLWASLVFVVYYHAVSFALNVRRRGAASS